VTRWVFLKIIEANCGLMWLGRLWGLWLGLQGRLLGCLVRSRFTFDNLLMREQFDSRHGGLVYWCWAREWESLWDCDCNCQIHLISFRYLFTLLSLGLADGVRRAMSYRQDCRTTTTDYALDNDWGYYCLWFVSIFHSCHHFDPRLTVLGQSLGTAGSTPTCRLSLI
jgi:hypothetical protein